MTLPIHFATLQGGPQPLSLLDRQFAALGNLTTIPCTYSSPDGNTITLTPDPDTPALHRYTDLAPQFIFIAGTTNTGPVTLNVMGAHAHAHAHPHLDEVDLGSQPPGAGWPPPLPPVPLGARPTFKAGGTQPLVAGDILQHAIYLATFAQPLNSGNGGFAVASYGDAIGLGTWQAWTPVVTAAVGALGSASGTGSRYVKFGPLVLFSASLTITSNGTGAANIAFTLPVPAVGVFALNGRDYANGVLLGGVVDGNSNLGSVWTDAEGYPGHDGALLIVSGFYQSAS